MRNIRGRSLVFIVMTVLAALCAVSCREVNDSLYMHYADIPSAGWHESQPASFEVTAADTTWRGASMQLVMHVRYMQSRPVGTFPVLVNVEDESGELLVDTVRVQLFDHRGHALYPRKFGLAEYTVTLMDNFPLRKGLSVNLTPLTEGVTTTGILNVGVQLKRYGSDTAAQ